MATSSTYCLEGSGGTKLAISKEELRALLARVEAELHHSEIYQKVLDGLQQSIGEVTDGSQSLVKALGREAIRLVLRRLIKQYSNHSSTRQTLTIESKLSPEASETPHLAQDTASQTYSHQRGHVSALPPAIETHHSSSRQGTSAVAPSYSVNTNSAVCETVPVKTGGAEAQGDTHHRPESQSVLKYARRLTQFQKANPPAAPSITEQRETSLHRIGQELRQARLKRAMSLEKVHYQTHIPIHQIKALEAGQTDQLPEDIYVRGFIRRIGDAVGLDGYALMSSLPSLEPAKIIAPSWQRVSAKPSNQLRPVHLYVGYAALMAGATGGLVWMTQQPMFNGGIDELPDLFENPSAQSSPQIDDYSPQFDFNPSGAISSPETLSPESQFDPDPLFP
ncbi:MAG: helix-turn-helix domain-containing protein [Elainellaceae cyanobacterium]